MSEQVKRYVYTWSESLGGYRCDDASGAGLPMVLAADHAAAVAALEKERDAFVTKAADNMRLYLDLLMQVVNVVPGETRHESAKRIIRQHENQSHGPDKSSPLPGEAR